MCDYGTLLQWPQHLDNRTFNHELRNADTVGGLQQFQIKNGLFGGEVTRVL
jgi:hypothetical protein